MLADEYAFHAFTLVLGLEASMKQRTRLSMPSSLTMATKILLVGALSNNDPVGKFRF